MPRDGTRVLLAEHGDGIPGDVELTILGLDRALEPAVDRVVLEHVHLLVTRTTGV